MPPVVIMRPPGDSYRDCLRKNRSVSIDPERAREQHSALAGLLASLGANVVRLPPLERFPDSVFVEDAGLVIGERAWVCAFAAESRRGEEEALRETLASYRPVRSFQSHAFIDGGDVIVADEDVFVGLSGRTNQAAFEQLARSLPDHRVRPIDIDRRKLLHLKSGASYLGRRTILAADGKLDLKPFGDYDVLITAAGEEQAANGLSLNDTVILSAGYPRTRTLLERNRFQVREVDLSEFAKGDGSVSCLCLVIG